MLLSYAHIFKKIFLKNYVTSESDGWILGGYAFVLFHGIIFLGIMLSATHLSDITLTVLANIFWSLFNNIHKTYYIIFTNKHLNIDEMTRMMMLHYFIPFYYLYLVQMHIWFCHESWDSDSGENTYEDKTGTYLSWFYDAMLKEFQDGFYWVLYVFLYYFFHHFNGGTVSYFFFERWNIAELDEIRFYGIAPHWYFRPLMGLLTICPTHYEGLFWTMAYLIGMACLPIIYNFYNPTSKYIAAIPMQNSLLQTTFFMLFMMSLYCVWSVLPCGRYYYEPSAGYVGNPWIKFSWQYIYLYFFWILHHLDVIDHHIFQFSQTYMRRATSYKNRTLAWRRLSTEKKTRRKSFVK
jgi:quinol-cytochrome oxidoreductase complex cytochrome b subunit